MSETSIQIRNLKKYYTYSGKKGFSVLDIPDLVRDRNSSGDPVIRVLDGIDLDIRKGECFGIIGANGTGKSTLLRLISGIIPPDSGTITVNGSLIPLLNLNVGFSGELTARDNVYQYGMILGFSKKKMDDLYSDIIRFADLEKFQDMHLKNFSSGMRVRLAFSTAIRIDPDILVLDEVLSVGDVNFKEKSQKKILEFCRSDKTVVIVSHSMSTISKICDRAMFLQDGRIWSIGNPEDVIDAYLDIMQGNLEPAQVAAAQKIIRQKDIRQNHQEYVSRVLLRIKEMNTLQIIRNHYDRDTERSVNDYLTFENLKKITDLEKLSSVSLGDGNEEDTALGSSFITFINKLGEESAALATATEMIRNVGSDRVVCFGGGQLAACFSTGSRPSRNPGPVVTLLICDGSRTIPVIWDIRQLQTIDYHSARKLFASTQSDPKSAVIILPSDLYSETAVGSLLEHSVRFLAPVPVQEIEEDEILLDLFQNIAVPENMMVFSDRPFFIRKGRFALNGNPVDGFGYFNPRTVPTEYKKYYGRLSSLGKIFSSTGTAQFSSPDAFIREVAKNDARYFSGMLKEGRPEISFNSTSVLRRQKLMGTVFFYHSGTWDARDCIRNYEQWWLSDQSIRHFMTVMTADTPLNRGKALLSMLNTMVRLGVVTTDPEP